jgi:asparagine synthase (glutamine-hydrolysing)
MVRAIAAVVRHLESFDFALVRSAVANYFVAALAREHGVKVVLAGEGADELFAVYHYIKEIPSREALTRELTAITGGLNNSNLQRVDRMSMAHGVEAREPFLDLGLLRAALGVAPDLKQRDGVEKWILRHAFRGILPDEVLWREKEKFSRGAGSALVFEEIAERDISDLEFARERRRSDTLELRSKEELYYYRLWRLDFPDSVIPCLGLTARPGDR